MNDFSLIKFHLVLWLSKRGFHRMANFHKVSQRSQHVPRSRISYINWCVWYIVIPRWNALNFNNNFFEIFVTADFARDFIDISCFVATIFSRFLSTLFPQVMSQIYYLLLKIIFINRIWWSFNGTYTSIYLIQLIFSSTAWIVPQN